MLGMLQLQEKFCTESAESNHELAIGANQTALGLLLTELIVSSILISLIKIQISLVSS